MTFLIIFTNRHGALGLSGHQRVEMSCYHISGVTIASKEQYLELCMLITTST